MKYTSANIRQWAKLGQRGTVFGIAMQEIAEKYENVKLLTADLALLSGIERFKKKYPERFMNVGIAEQNMIGIAAGLAMEGYSVYATTYASFIAVRSLEHVRQHLAYLGCNVKLLGTSAGVVGAKSGVSHWATEDIAFMRSLPNMTVISPADSMEAVKALMYSATVDKPMYIRLSGGLNCPIVYGEDYDFEVGKLVRLKDGDKVAIIATGLMVNEAAIATQILEEKGIKCALYNMHTIKPIDEAGLAEIFAKYDIVVTVEEHNVVGGMGSAVAEYKAKVRSMSKQVFIGIEDTYLAAGSQRYVWEQAGLTGNKIAERICKEIGC